VGRPGADLIEAGLKEGAGRFARTPLWVWFCGLCHGNGRVAVCRLRWRMTISFARHQFPPAIIRHAVWLYVRFTLSYRDVEDLLAERGLDVSYETVRRWVLKFGPLFARELRRRRPRPTSQWHLDEMAVMIVGRQFWL
jgi:hypothetical protein